VEDCPALGYRLNDKEEGHDTHGTPLFSLSTSFLREKDVRPLSILLSRLGILQVLRGPVLPSCAGERIDAWPVISDSEDLERIRLYLKGYFDFAEQLGEKGLLACRGWIALAGEDLESRFRIQDRVRGEGSEEEDRKERLLLEAAIFHEIARNLDEKELEVVSGMVEVERLEEEFRRILGSKPGRRQRRPWTGRHPPRVRRTRIFLPGPEASGVLVSPPIQPPPGNALGAGGIFSKPPR